MVETRLASFDMSRGPIVLPSLAGLAGGSSTSVEQQSNFYGFPRRRSIIGSPTLFIAAMASLMSRSVCSSSLTESLLRSLEWPLRRARLRTARIVSFERLQMRSEWSNAFLASVAFAARARAASRSAVSSPGLACVRYTAPKMSSLAVKPMLVRNTSPRC